MTDNTLLLSDEEHALIDKVRGALGSEFSSLVALAKLDPSRDFRFLNLAEIDFAGSDLRGYDFTGANLDRSNWVGAIYDETTILNDASLEAALGIASRVVHTPRATRSSSHQVTLRSTVTLSGVGVHSGLPVTMTLGPAPADAGLIFIRSGLEQGSREVPATYESVISTEFATVLGDHEGPLVSTAEHVLAALIGMGIDNATIELDGPEVPIMDGSAAAYVAAIDQAGILEQLEPRRFIEVVKPIRVSIGESVGELRPYPDGFRVEVEIELGNPIGRQSFEIDVTPDNFRREVCRARTFGSVAEVSRLWSAGFALGSSFENTLVFDEDRLLNSEGLRYPDECARHKALDVVGDFALAGLPLLGACRSVQGGHKLNHAILAALIANKKAWRIVEAKDRSATAEA